MAETSYGKQNRSVHVADDVDQWVAIQTKTFTRWCNSHLKMRQLQIDDLMKDVSDGCLLLNLLEIIGKDSIKSICGRNFYPKEKCKMEIHKLENCNLILDYLKKKELKLVNIGSSDIKDGNTRLILGLLWTVILRFAIDEDGKEGLLLWCRKNTAGYQNVDVQNFARSWQDGLAFCALIHHFRPDLIDFDECLAKGDNMWCLNKAFDVAQNDLDIDRLLDAEDIALSAKPDEKSIIAYLSIYFQKFASLAQKDNLADAIKKALAVTRHHESCIENYNADSAALKSWIAANSDKGDLSNVGSTEEVSNLIQGFYDFRNSDKPNQQQKLVAVEALLTNLRLSQRNNERPLYAPSIESDDLESDWSSMEKEEQKFEAATLELLDLFEHTDYALQRFTNKVQKVEAFVASNLPTFESNNFGDSVSTCDALVKKCEVFENQSVKYRTLLNSCGEYIGQCAGQHAGTADATARYEAACAGFAAVKEAASAFEAGVQAKLENEKRLLALREKYENDLANFEFQLFEYQEVLMEPVSLCNNVDAVVEVMNRTDQVAAQLTASEEEIVALEAVRVELGEYPVDKEVSTVRELYDSVLVSVPERQAKLNFARAAQQSKAEMRSAFAAAATALVEYCSEVSRLTANCGRRMSITADKQAAKLDEIFTGFNALGAPFMKSVEDAHEAQTGAGIYTNALTPLTVFSCRGLYEECEKALKAAIDMNAAHLLAQSEGASMSAETAKEIRETFDTFDADKSGVLSLKEFIFGLQGMGVVMSDGDAEVVFKKLDLNDSNSLSFDEFAGYILEQFKSGSTESDIRTAWKGLADGQPTIQPQTLAQFFGADKDMLNYVQERMVDGDYESYTTTMFQQ